MASGAVAAYRKYQVIGIITIVFGIVSVLCGIIFPVIWSTHIPAEYMDVTQGHFSGHTLLFVCSAGIWCGAWVIAAGSVGCSITIERPYHKIARLRMAHLLLNAFASFLFCIVQIIIYGILILLQDPWLAFTSLQVPVWWAQTFPMVGLIGGVGGFISCFVGCGLYCCIELRLGQHHDLTYQL